MTSWMVRGMAGALMAGFVTAAMTAAIPAAAATSSQETTNRVATKTDWSVFTEGTPKECWGVSSPKSSAITKNGKRVAANRGNILLFVTFRSGKGGSGEVSFTGGYPFSKDKTATMKIGDTSFDMITKGEWAWPARAGDDPKVIKAMKNGVDAVLTAYSTRGKKTKDTFSLLGFTAALGEAAKRCK